MSTDRYYWFGVLVDSAGHVKLRQVHVYAEYGGGSYIVEVWNRGIAGKLWYVRTACVSETFAQALEWAKEHIASWSFAYTTVEEGEPFSADRHSPQGAAHPAWWADTLNVEPDADAQSVRKAFRERARETHPDLNPELDGSEFRAVYAAWEYYQKSGGYT